jgi:hypothetical protein
MKILISSTIYDLKDLRASLKDKLETNGHEVIASEHGTVPIASNKHSYEQCLDAVENCDCLIALIGGRFGGEYPPNSGKSITEAEIERAIERGKRTLVFVRQSVWDALATQKEYRKDGVPYKPVNNIVEDTRVFDVLDRLRKKPKDNWLFFFNNQNDLFPQIDAQLKTKSQIDWLQISTERLTHQKNLTTNLLQLGANRNIDEVHVPLGLMERKERPKAKQEPSPEEGSQLIQATELTETKRFEHEEFLAEVVGKRETNSKYIAIIGEPGAGKTTLLTKIGEWLVNQADDSQPLAVIWVSLAAVGNRRLEDYLKEEWLRQVCETERLEATWAALKELRQGGRVWLLLDGLDEMSGDSIQEPIPLMLK